MTDQDTRLAQLTVTLVTGVGQPETDACAEALGVGSTVTLAYRVIEDGPLPLISRRIEWSARPDVEADETIIATTHGCIGCAVRDDVLCALVEAVEAGAVGTALVVLPLGTDPSCVVDPLDLGCWVDQSAAAGRISVGAVVTALDADAVEETVSTDDEVREAGIPYGPFGSRPLAEVAINQIVQSDVLVTYGLGPSDEHDTRRVTALLEHLAPHATQARGGIDSVLRQVARDAGHTKERTELSHENVGIPYLQRPDAAGVGTLVWRATRPMHPARLYDALEELAGTAVYLRGHAWVANRPHEVLRLDVSGGAAAVSRVDAWLVDAPDEVWEDVSAHRRTHAALTWDDYYGDRCHEVVVTVLAEGCADDELARARSALERTLLDDAELAGGGQVWTQLVDPFAPWLGEPWSEHPARAQDEPARDAS